MNDLTIGNPLKILIRFSLPMLISMIFQQMYNIADSVIAGQMISVDALAAIGAAYPATVLFLAVRLLYRCALVRKTLWALRVRCIPRF